MGGNSSSENMYGELANLIRNHVRIELKRMYGFKRVYNPLALQLINTIDPDKTAYLVRVFMEYSVNIYGRDRVYKTEAKSILKEIGFPQVLYTLGAKGSLGGREDPLMSMMLSDLRRLGVMRLAVVDNIVYRLPIIYPTWRDNIRIGRRKLGIVGIFSKRIMNTSEKMIKDALFLSYFEGSPITEVIIDTYTRYGEFNVAREGLISLINEKIVSMYMDIVGGDNEIYSFIKGFYGSNRVHGKIINSIKYIFRFKDTDILYGDRIVIPSDLIEYIIERLNIKLVSYNQYLQALKRAWSKYWRGLKPWYASLEKLYHLVNEELCTLLNREVRLSLNEHIRYVSELARWGRIEYWVGGTDPRYRHWIRLS